jgi:hypothetical protein
MTTPLKITHLGGRSLFFNRHRNAQGFELFHQSSSLSLDLLRSQRDTAKLNIRDAATQQLIALEVTQL